MDPKNFERRSQAAEAIEQELRGERAAALGRIARKLEQRIQRLHDLRRQIPTLKGRARQQAIERYQRTRADARQYLWYMRIQREANGLRDHRDMARLYTIPGPWDEPRSVASSS